MGCPAGKVSLPGNRQRKKTDLKQDGDFALIPNNLLTALQVLRNISARPPGGYA